MFNQEKIIDTFIKYVKTDSESSNEKAFSMQLQEELKAMGAKVSVDDAGAVCGSNANNLYAEFEGDQDQEPLVFSCHMDTVTPGIGISPKVEGDLIVSDGDTILGSDDKAGITALMEAMKHIAAEGKAIRPVQFVFTISEETGLLGAKNLDYDRLIAKKCYVLDSSGPVGKLIVQTPGQFKINAVIHGKPAHAGIAPEKGVSALMVGAEAISQMKLLRIDEETTANIGTFEAVGATNIVSPIAKIVGEVRSLDLGKADKQKDHMVKCLEETAERYGATLELHVEKMYEPYHYQEDDDVVEFVAGFCRQIGVEPFFASTGGGSDANIYNARGVRSINLGCGVTNAHTLEECIKIEDLVKLTELAYAMMIVE